MPARIAPAAVFVGFALAAGILQVLATIDLGLARIDALDRAAAEGSTVYIFAGCVMTLGMVLLVILPRRPVVVLAIGGGVAVATWLLSRRMSSLGFALHGEYILHHFCAFLGFAASVSLAWAWFRRPTLGRMRFAAAVPAGLGSLILVIAHVFAEPPLSDLGVAWLFELGTLLFVVATATAIALLWRSEGPRAPRVAVTAIALTFVLRIVLGLPESLHGGPVPIAARTPLMSTLVIAAVVAFVGLRPALSASVRVLVLGLSGLATSLIYMVYRRGFGELEDGISGLAHSLLGFTPPYPDYVEPWLVVAVMTALFCIFCVVYSELMSSDGRTRGVALGLLAVTGIGLTQPQLVLMASAGLLLLVHQHLRQTDALAAPLPPTPIGDILQRVARELGLPAPVVLETGKRQIVTVRGDLAGSAIDLRARPRGAVGWSLTLRTGIRGRGRPDVELVPDAGQTGDRPAHALARTHRVRGSVRSLETLGDESMDALRPFKDATVRLWSAGAEVDFGRDLSRLEPIGLASLVRSLGGR